MLAVSVWPPAASVSFALHAPALVAVDEAMRGPVAHGDVLPGAGRATDGDG